IRELDIIPDVDSYIIVVYGVSNKPIKSGVPIFQIFTAPESSVRDICQSGRYADADQHTIYFIRLMILVGPPNTSSQTLTGCRDPMFAVTVFFEIKATIPRGSFCLYRMAGIINSKFILSTGFDFIR